MVMPESRPEVIISGDSLVTVKCDEKCMTGPRLEQ